jgi:cold shock CspA family protein
MNRSSSASAAPAPVATEHGIVTNLQLNRNFGFLRSDDGIDRFFHSRENPEFFNLTLGARVEYEPFEHENGLRARNVRKL